MSRNSALRRSSSTRGHRPYFAGWGAFHIAFPVRCGLRTRQLWAPASGERDRSAVLRPGSRLSGGPRALRASPLSTPCSGAIRGRRSMNLPAAVKVVEVGPRDGLQNESAVVPLETKVALIDRLSATGLPAIEAGSFVSPRWVPQMADTGEVLAAIRRAPDVVYPVLTPNLHGFERARQARATEVAVFSAASESFSRRNTNCSVEESLDRAGAVAAAANAARMRVRGYVSCTLGCPYEGGIDPRSVAEVAERLLRLGCYEVSLGGHHRCRDSHGSAGNGGVCRRVGAGGAPRDPFPRHLRAGAGEHSGLPRAGDRRRRLRGGGSRGMSLCSGRHR